MAAQRHSGYRLEWISEISAVPREAWDALSLPLDTPALEWEWLRQMEVSGSMQPETGWQPLHLTVWSGPQLVAAAPLYVKGHSEGEFVWDYIWVDVAGQLGVRYYPKMVGMSPATPISGYRFLLAPGDEEPLTALMVEAIDQLCRRNDLGVLSFNYIDPSWREAMEKLGFVSWRHQSYVWENPGFQDFDDYLWSFDKNQRRNIRRERKKVAEQGLVIRPYTGQQITPGLLKRMYHFYELTNAQFGPWAAKYLTEEFFTGLYERYRHRLLLMAVFPSADRALSEPVGMSFLLTKNDRLYGRYWGSSGRFDSLHFAACYYSPIEWAIQHGIHHFDPGIGSAHKLRRGFQATSNWSLHRFHDSRMSRIMGRHIHEINALEQERIDALNEAVPFAGNRSPLKNRKSLS
jgi:predicted N-acyltransferase